MLFCGCHRTKGNDARDKTNQLSYANILDTQITFLDRAQ